MTVIKCNSDTFLWFNRYFLSIWIYLKYINCVFQRVHENTGQFSTKVISLLQFKEIRLTGGTEAVLFMVIVRLLHEQQRLIWIHRVTLNSTLMSALYCSGVRYPWRTVNSEAAAQLSWPHRNKLDLLLHDSFLHTEPL